MKKDSKVKITKLGHVKGRGFLTPSMEGYRPGQDNGNVSLPISYNVEGYLHDDIRVGDCVGILRTKRNGVAATGITRTTPVCKITDGGFETENSVYSVEVLK